MNRFNRDSVQRYACIDKIIFFSKISLHIPEYFKYFILFKIFKLYTATERAPSLGVPGDFFAFNYLELKFATCRYLWEL